ncbi:MAG: helix-turn-helix domain-containing protein [Rhodobacteraceae bacterium]|nr:helix-turn-helix domain-containing protein [Paracoccaceae bacterium]
MAELKSEGLWHAFAVALKSERTAQNLSQEELARRSGLSARYISYLETERYQPKLETLGQVCIGLGLSLSEFAKKIEIFCEKQL